jgi:hypothetical protein
MEIHAKDLYFLERAFPAVTPNDQIKPGTAYPTSPSPFSTHPENVESKRSARLR